MRLLQPQPVLQYRSYNIVDKKTTGIDFCTVFVKMSSCSSITEPRSFLLFCFHTLSVQKIVSSCASWAACFFCWYERERERSCYWIHITETWINQYFKLLITKKTVLHVALQIRNQYNLNLSVINISYWNDYSFFSGRKRDRGRDKLNL